MHAGSDYRRTFLQTEESGVEVVSMVQGENSDLRLLVRGPLTRGGRGAAQAAALKTYLVSSSCPSIYFQIRGSSSKV